MSNWGLWGKEVEFCVLIGQTIESIEGLKQYSEEVKIKTKEGNEYLMYHGQDCCESVQLEDFNGDISDIVGGLIVNAEEIESADGPEPDHAESYSWTFYKIDTNKGSLFMRWLGESNGYYSEEVDFAWLNKPDSED